MLDPESQKLFRKYNLRAERHRIALEKLQLAWMKKTLTLSALGFACYRFFYSRQESGKAPIIELFNGRNVGIFLIGLGILGLFLATVQHVRNYSQLRADYSHIRYSVALVQSILLLVFFVFLLAMVFMHM